MSLISVHKYKWSQMSRRRILKKLWKEGYLNLKEFAHDKFWYEINSSEGMEEYKKRFKINSDWKLKEKQGEL